MRRALVAAAAALLVLVGAGLAYYLRVEQRSRDVEGSSTVEFVTTQALPPPPREPGIAWPTYGHDAQRLRFANGIALAPPFRRAWTFRARSLVEFPPAVAYGRLFFANNAGVVFAIGAKNGRRAWKYASKRCVAASPAVDRHVVYETFLNAPPCNRKPGATLTGELIAFSVGGGKVLWRRKISPSESSPVVAAGSVFVGDWSGRVYAFRRSSGRLRWVTKLRGQVKSGVSIAGERAYVGDYSGRVYALDIRSGRIVWEAKAQPRFGRAGNFYGSPAVAYGRVYIGATDGKVYSFGASSGKLRWSRSTGGFVYASPAVWRRRVYVGSYSRRFFALDAATGDVLWQFKANGPVSGSATVVAGRVYFATLRGMTYALDATSGRQVWSFPDGKYSPVVADAERLYLIGNARLYGLDELRRRTARRLSAVSVLRVLRAAGFRRLRVVGTRPLALRIGEGRARARRNACHVALIGAGVNVGRAAAALRRVCP